MDFIDTDYTSCIYYCNCCILYIINNNLIFILCYNNFVILKKHYNCKTKGDIFYEIVY